MVTIKGSRHLHTEGHLKISVVPIHQIFHQGREVLHLHTLVGHGATHPRTSQKVEVVDNKGFILKVIHQMEDHSVMLALFCLLLLTVQFRFLTAWFTALNRIPKTTGGLPLT